MVVLHRFPAVTVAICSLLLSPASGHAFTKRQDGSRSQLQDFCDRRYATTAVVDQRLYVNGGQNVANRTKSTNTYTNFHDIQYIDLSSSWTIDNPPLSTKAKPDTLINVNEGCAWSDGESFYQYGGWQTTEPVQEDFRVWDYNVSSDAWSSVSTNTNVNRLASGGYTNAPQIKKSYAYGGFMDGATTYVPYYANTGALEGFISRADIIEFDWETKIATNITYTNKASKNLTVVDNPLAYVPTGGGSGVLLSLGGRLALNFGYSSDLMSDMSQINFFDIATSTWYTQAAEGATTPSDIPSRRVEPCTVVQPAADLSSINIYMFGGSIEDLETAAYNDMWILSLPSFKWFKVANTADSDDQIPGERTSHSCQIIGNRQMAIIGGGRSAAAHEQCKNTALFIFDMSTLSYRAGFDPAETAYVVPGVISDVIGGNGTGNADPSKNKPSSWTSSEVEGVVSELFVTVDPSTTTSTGSTGSSAGSSAGSSKSGAAETSNSSSTPTGAIAGGVVGGIAVLAGIGIGILFLRRRRRRQASPNSPSATLLGNLEPGAQELHSNGLVAHELQGPVPPKTFRPKSLMHELPVKGGGGKDNSHNHGFFFGDNSSVSELPGSTPARIKSDGLMIKPAQVIPSPISPSEQDSNEKKGLPRFPGLPALPESPAKKPSTQESLS